MGKQHTHISLISIQVITKFKAEGFGANETMRFDPPNPTRKASIQPEAFSLFVEPVYMIVPHVFFTTANTLGQGQPPCPTCGFESKRTAQVC